MPKSKQYTYLRFVITLILSIIGGLASKIIWVTVFAPGQAPSIRLFAIWLPLQYIGFAAYYLYLETRLGKNPSLTKSQNRDGFTHLGWLVVFLMEITYKDIGPWGFWFIATYVTILIIKLIIAILFWLDKETSPNDPSGKPFPRSRDLFLISFLFYFLLSPIVIQSVAPEGDEPYILLITHSLIHDHDINLYNNLANKDYRQFSPLLTFDLSSQPQDIVQPGYYRSHHPPIFPLLLIPGYVMAGRFGVTWEMNLLTALMIAVLFSLCSRLFTDRRAVLLGTICTAFSAPVVIYSATVYREIPAALLLTVLLYKIETLNSGIRKKWFGILGWLMLLALFGVRYAIPVIPIFLVLTYWLWKEKNIIGMVTLSSLLLIGLISFGFYYHLFQITYFENLIYQNFIKWWKFPMFVTGMFFDQQRGLFFYAPIYLFSIFGIIAMGFRCTKRTWFLVTLCILYIFSECVFVNAFGWEYLTVRYLIFILPVGGLLLTAFFTRYPATRLLVYVLAILGFLSASITYFDLIFPLYRHNLYHSMKSQFLTEIGTRLHTDLGRFFPAYLRINQARLLFPFFSGLIILFLLYLYQFSLRRKYVVTKPVEPLYFSFAIVGIVSLFLTTAIHTPMRIVEMEDSENISSKTGVYYPNTDKVLTDFPNNEENFGVQMDKNGEVEAFGRFPSGLTEISLLNKGDRVYSFFPYIDVKFNRKDFGQSELDGFTTWRRSTFIGETQGGYKKMTLSYLNHLYGDSTDVDRQLLMNKIYFKPSQLKIIQKAKPNSEYEILFNGTVPRSMRTLNFQTHLSPGDYILHAEIQPGFERKLFNNFGIKLNSKFLSRNYIGNIATNPDIYYLVHSDTKDPELGMLFLWFTFQEVTGARIVCPIKKITFIPYSQDKIPIDLEQQKNIYYHFGQQVVSRENDLKVQLPDRHGPRLGFLWTKMEADKNYGPVILNVKDSNGKILSQIPVTLFTNKACYFQLTIPEKTDSLVFSMADTTRKDSKDEGPYLYLHKFLLVPDTAFYRQRAGSVY